MKSLPDLPTELILSITDLLPLQATKSLNLSNKKFHRISPPTLFKSLRATSQHQDSEIISTVISKHGQHVEKLVFDLCVFPANAEEGAGERYIPSSQPLTLSNVARKLLSGETASASLPKISSLRITPLYNEDVELDIFGEEFYLQDPPETSLEETLSQEAKWPARTLVREMYSALINWKSLRKLELREVDARVCSIFYTASWKNFLSGLEDFDIEFWGCDNGEGWHSNTMEGYLGFIEQTNEFFFKHLKSVKRVRFVADEDNPIGMVGFRHSPIPFQPRDMPKVECLELENCFVDPALAAWVGMHGQVLRSLRLRNCFAGTVSTDEDYTWAEFFQSILEEHISSSPIVLEELLIVNDGRRIALTRDEEDHEEEEGGPFVPGAADEPENISAIRRRVRDESNNCRAWPYYYLDDKYGMVFQAKERNVRAFEAGEDQEGFEVLMGIVRRNRRSAVGDESEGC